MVGAAGTAPFPPAAQVGAGEAVILVSYWSDMALMPADEIKTRTAVRSLRTRYLILIGVLGAVLLVGAVIGQRSLSQSSSAGAAQLQARNQVLEHSQAIRVGVFEGYKSLNAFLLDPTRQEHRPRIAEFLEQAISNSDRLLTDAWVADHEQSDNVQRLRRAAVAMHSNIEQLIETRLEPTRQYPALAAANEVMSPNRNAFNNAIALALRETAQLAQEDEAARQVLARLFEARHLWSQTVSNFRLYLANRVGSFDEASLPIQERGIRTLQGELEKQLRELAELDAEGRLGFETAAAVEQMIGNLSAYGEGLARVKAIHASDEWRADIKFIKDAIEPELNLIATLLNTIEKAIADSAGEDLALLTDAITLQTRFAWLISLLGLVFVAVIVLSLNLLVFRPIRAVAEGLKAEAFGEEGVAVPSAGYQETQDLVTAFSEMRKQVHQRQADLQHQAYHDSLTNLPNRLLLQDRMEQAIQIARRHHTPFAFLMMDLDRFKDVNDTLGHHVGDQLLAEVGQRLHDTLREVDTIARLGGDEFAILLMDSDAKTAQRVAQKITDALSSPFDINSLRLYIGASIGIACYPEHGLDVTTLIQRADVAMYVAKRDQSTHALYALEQDNYSVSRLALMADLRQALQQDALTLHFQPKLDLASGQVLGVEALLRWQHPEYGAIPPEQVVVLAEHTGLIGPLTQWVMENALATAAAWRKQGLILTMAVNLSVHNLRDPAFQTRVSECLALHQLPAEVLTLEITEHAMMANPAEATRILRALDEMGVMLAVDDYGTGFSSLAYLKQLPVDELKIDKSFVMRMHENPNDEIIVRSTIDLAHNLGLRVVAEGVEHEQAWHKLSALGCDAAQGYYMSRPLPPDQIHDWLSRQSGNARPAAALRDV
jgi:diguanylate cyclase (GGDEF)-like protein